jgi:hypothetical protein
VRNYRETSNVSEFTRKYFCFSGSKFCFRNNVSTGGLTGKHLRKHRESQMFPQQCSLVCQGLKPNISNHKNEALSARMNTFRKNVCIIYLNLKVILDSTSVIRPMRKVKPRWRPLTSNSSEGRKQSGFVAVFEILESLEI